MKKFVLLFAIALVSLVSFAETASAMGKPKGLEIEGTVTKKGRRLKGAKVEIFKGNDIIETFTTEKDGHFFYTMEFDGYYGIQVSMDGHLVKRMWFDTSTEFKDFKYEPFQCFIEVLPEETFGTVDVSNLDFPVAIVSYDKRLEEFIPKKKYSKSMRTEYNRLLSEAEMASEDEK